MSSSPVRRDDESHEFSGYQSLANSERSFLALLLTQIFGVFHENFLRWLAVLLLQPAVGTVAAVTLGGVCLAAPYLFLMPVSGWLADRFAKRSVINACKFAEVLLAAASAITILYGDTWQLCGILVLMGIIRSFLGPAQLGCLPELLPLRKLSRANGVYRMGSIVAVGLGTVCAFAVMDRWTLVLQQVSWASALPCSLILGATAVAGLFSSLWIQSGPAGDPQQSAPRNPISHIAPALRLLKDDRRILRAALGISFFYFIAALTLLNINPFGETALGFGKTEIGLLLGMVIAGIGAGSLLAGVWSEGKIELGIIGLGAIVISLSSILVSIFGYFVNPHELALHQTAYWGVCVTLFLFGTGAGLYVVPIEAYLQFRTEVKNRGQMIAGSYFIVHLLVLASFGVFYLLSGVLGTTAGVLFFLMGIFSAFVANYAIRLTPDWSFRFGMWLITKSIYRLRIHGAENIPEHGPALLVSNHVSFLDGVILCISSRRFVRFLVYTDFTEMPLLKLFGRVMRVIPVRAEDGPVAMVKSINAARDALKNREVVCIFAEGGLTRTGQMQPFQRGLLKIVRGMDVPVVPTYLYGLWGSIFSWRGGKVIRKWPERWPFRIDVHFGQPVHNPKDVAVVRQVVEQLGAEAANMNAAQQLMIPARRFIRQCKASKLHTKVSDSTKAELTGGKLLAASLTFRRVLRRMALSPDEKRVGLLVPPSVGGCVSNMALALDGRTSVNLNYTLSDDVLNYCVKKAGLKHVLTSRKFLEKKPFDLKGAEFVFLEDVKEQATALDKAIAAAQAFLLPAPVLDRLLGLTKIDSDDTLTIVFTSGSTGEPKGVVLSHSNIGSNIEAVDYLLNLKPVDGVLGVLPFFHSFGYTACMWLPMCYPLRGVYHFNPLDAKVVGKLCEDHKITIMMATPTFLKMYMKRCETDQFKTVDLIVVGAEKLPVELAKQFEEKFHILPTEGYGTTELSPVAAVNIPDHRSRTVYQQGTRLGTVGRPLPGVTAKIVDPETLEDRGIGTEGLLLIKGPNVMRGYLDEPEKTNELVHDGWYNTGDFAMLDQDGFLIITGRQSRFSKIAGEMVPHIRIEQELFTICEPPNDEEGKLFLAVTAVPDEDRGERIIVLYSQLCKPVDQVIRELAQTGIPKLWMPSADSFIAVESIPVLGTGKLDLRAVKDMALQAICPAAAP